jgi:uncharacterized protein with GYD domain
MPSYLVLANWTEKGIQEVKSSPQRLESAKQAIKAAGGRLVYFYMTMGQYDLAFVVELPDDDAAARVLLGIGSQGNIRTTTLKAFTEDQYRTVIASAP